MSFRILFAGGGSGGHVYPLVAVAQDIQQAHADKVRMRFIGDGALMARSAREIGVPFRRVWAPKFRRYASLKNFLDLFKLPFAIVQSFFHVWIYMPDVMLVTGGYASFFPALAARLMFVPIIVHECDSVPGKTNLFWARHARRVFLAFEHARTYFKSDLVEVIGNPIRPILLKPVDRAQALQAFNLPPEKPVVFITGGSQGAQAVNDIVDLAKFELEKSFSLIHSRDGSFDVQRMAMAYAAADVVVSRAGSAIFEIAAAGKPAILIPLKGSAQEHQIQNAREFERHGAIVMDQDNLLPHLLINEIKHAYEQREVLSQQIKQFAKLDAAGIIAKELLEAAS